VSQQINLFNPVFLKQTKVFSAVAMARALGLLLAGIVAVAFYGNRGIAALQQQVAAGNQQVARKQVQLATVNAEFAPRQKSAQLAAQIEQAEVRLHALRTVSGVLERGELGNTEGYSEYFKALARQNANGMWLTAVSIAGAGNEIEVQGRALAPTLIPGYLGRLAHERILRGKGFGSLRISQAELEKRPAPYVEFSLQSQAAPQQVAR
jgi:hypothetical protein